MWFLAGVAVAMVLALMPQVINGAVPL